MQIAVDGPAGSGKSTISKMIANQLKFEYIDTGAMYRAITLKSMNQDIRPEEYDKLERMLHDTDIDFKDGHIYLDGIVVDEAIRENKINQNVSNYAVIKFIRLWMVDIQRKIASNKDVIMDGRDIGSYVLPKAELKFFLTASAEERGNRRYKELTAKGVEIDLAQVIDEIKKRDHIDSTREFAPLKRADGAIEIDTTFLDIEGVIEAILSYVNR